MPVACWERRVLFPRRGHIADLIHHDDQTVAPVAGRGPGGAAGNTGSNHQQLVGLKDANLLDAARVGRALLQCVSTDQGGRFHIWRQRFPKGEPEQVTPGPTEEVGIAMERDGRSFLTSVRTADSTIWVHDEKGDHQMSSEGETCAATFSKDGTKLFYVKNAGQNNLEELWSTELASGSSERVVPGYEISGDYAVANDGNRVAFAMKDEKGISR